MDLSHAEVQQLHADRIAAAAQAEHVRVVAAADKAEEQRRDKLRFDECLASSVYDDATVKTTYNCKCGGRWSNGLTGFKSHESSKKYTTIFLIATWPAFYASHPAPIVEAVAAAVAPQ